MARFDITVTTRAVYQIEETFSIEAENIDTAEGIAIELAANEDTSEILSTGGEYTHTVTSVEEVGNEEASYG